MDIKILVATHKDYFMPHDDGLYLPIKVGNALSRLEGRFQGDDTGENISEKNPYYCELTALYWGWKNLNSDYIGLVHYRRHFCLKRIGNNWESVLTRKQAEYLCQNYDIILPVKRRYWIETLASHYCHTHDIRHLELTREIIATDYPQYLLTYDKVLKRRSAHMFNMFVMKKEWVDKYCTWLFDILSQLEKRIDLRGMDSFQARLLGRISELLLDVWIEANQLKYKEIKYVPIGPYHFWKKVKAFLNAKLYGKQYNASV